MTSLKLVYSLNLMRLTMILSSRKSLNISTDNVMMILTLIKEDKVECSADSLNVLEIEILNLSKTCLSSIEKIKKTIP